MNGRNLFREKVHHIQLLINAVQGFDLWCLGLDFQWVPPYFHFMMSSTTHNVFRECSDLLSCRCHRNYIVLQWKPWRKALNVNN